MRFHVNPTSGEAGACRAAEGNCPFKSSDGSEAPHYSTLSEARRGYEEAQGGAALSGSHAELQRLASRASASVGLELSTGLRLLEYFDFNDVKANSKFPDQEVVKVARELHRNWERARMLQTQKDLAWARAGKAATELQRNSYIEEYKTKTARLEEVNETIKGLESQRKQLQETYTEKYRAHQVAGGRLMNASSSPHAPRLDSTATIEKLRARLREQAASGRLAELQEASVLIERKNPANLVKAAQLLGEERFVKEAEQYKAAIERKLDLLGVKERVNQLRATETHSEEAYRHLEEREAVANEKLEATELTIAPLSTAMDVMRSKIRSIGNFYAKSEAELSALLKLQR